MNTRALTDKYKDWQRMAGEKARNATQATDHYVRENTWSTIAIAAAVGAVLGYLLAGRREEEN